MCTDSCLYVPGLSCFGSWSAPTAEEVPVALEPSTPPGENKSLPPQRIETALTPVVSMHSVGADPCKGCSCDVCGAANHPRCRRQPASATSHRRFLAESGWIVLESGDAEEALRIIDRYEEPVDLLVTDIVIPGRYAGFALAAEVVGRHPDIHVLYMSGHFGDRQPVRQGLREAGRSFLKKPFGRDEFRRVVDAALRSPVHGADAFAAILSHPLVSAQAIADRPPKRRPARSLRYRVRIPVRYRVAGVSEWEVGLTEDISRTGVLVETRHPNLVVPTAGERRAVEVRLELPSRGRQSTEVVCRRYLARATMPDADERPTRLAVAVTAYHTAIRADLR
jgi:DNA-binding NarL/FixJ family response regulator